MTATPAPVNYRPFSIIPNPHANRVHNSPAALIPVAGFVVEVKTREAVRAMIPVSFAVNRGIDFPPANFARKTFLAGVVPVIILVVTPALVLTVHDLTSSSLDFMFSWEALKFYSLFQTPRPETVSVNEFLNTIKFSPL